MKNNKIMTNNYLIPEYLAKQVLTLGPDKNGKGGMASVLKSYESCLFQPFYFEKTTGEGSILYKLFLSLKVLVYIPFYVFIKRIKIIHIHGASWNSFERKRIITYYCSLFPVDIIFHLHGGAFQIYTKKQGIKKIKSTFFKCKKIIVLSKRWQDFIHNTIGCHNTAIVNNIIPYPQKQAIRKNNEIIHLLYLGVIGERKGIFDLLRVIAANKACYAGKLKLTIGGNGKIEKMKQYIVENNLGTIVEYAGWVSGERKIDLLNTCDVYVLPSYNEGLPVSILEAMSYGKPVISTNVGGIPEIVRHAGNGYLIQPGDITALAESINKFIENKELINQFGQYSEKIAEDFLPGKVSLQLINVYNELLKR